MLRQRLRFDQQGINTVEEGEAFLNLIFRGYIPFLMKDMSLAVDLFSDHQSRRINRCYGDYDVDGITSTALLVSCCSDWRTVFPIFRTVQEGYGLNTAALDYLKGRGASTVVTVDCGINSVEEAEYARRLQMKMVITDHHQPAAVLPEAAAVINPLRADCSYPLKIFCERVLPLNLDKHCL